MASDLSDLETHLGYWLRFDSNHVSHAFSGRIAAHGVTVAEWVVMRALHDHLAIAPSALAKDLGMTRGAISKLADRLVDKDLITRKAEEVDGRYQSLGLTARGRKLVPVLAEEADRNDAAFFGGLNAQERTTITNAMRKIVRDMELKSIPTQ